MIGGDLLDNGDARLAPFWHPITRASDPCPDEARLFGRVIPTATGSMTSHLGLSWFAPAAPVAPLPEVPEDDDEHFVRVPSEPWSWRTDAGRMADNFCDLGHLPFVHATSFADPADQLIGHLDVRRNSTGFDVIHDHVTKRLRDAGTGARRMVLRFVTPFSVILRLEYPEEDTIITTGFLHQPVAPGQTILWAINWRDDIIDGRCSAVETTAFQELVGAEDRVVFERITPTGLPLDVTAEVHTRADAPTLAIRRVLADLLGPPPGPPVGDRRFG